MKIINPGKEDYHTHTIIFSDGINTIDELVKMAGEIGLKKLAITDHSQDYLDKKGFIQKTYRFNIKRWRNIHNDVEVIFGVEGDILHESGEMCLNIQDDTPDLVIASAHRSVYFNDPTTITKAYLNAIKKNHKKISFLGHPCTKSFADFLNIEEVIKAANDYNLPMEFNCANFFYNKTNLNHLEKMLCKCDRIYVNSDAHTLFELKTLREEGLKYLRNNGFLK